MPLSEMGLPAALCRLVSSLMDASAADDEDCGGENVGGGGGGSGDDGGGDDDDGGDRCRYRSAAEVEEDLDLMKSDPDRFLFDPPPADRCVRPDFAGLSGGGGGGPLFGREREVSALIGAYDRTAAGASPAGGGIDAAAGGGERRRRLKNEVVLLSGYSGTGKSSIVRRAREELVARGAHFVSGKFDCKAQQPLGAVVCALNEYCRLLGRLDDDALSAVRGRASATLGGEGRRVLVDLIPSLGTVLLPEDVDEPPTASLWGAAAQRRLMFLFRMFFRSASAALPSHPIVLFLDDLQWADEASLQLLHAVATDVEINALLVVGTHREVESDHPLTVSVRAMVESGNVAVETIRVGNMNLDSVNSLISHSLRMLPRRTRPLAEVVLAKTGGNALFVTQFLESLLDAGLLRYSLSSRQWQWTLRGIQAREIADNVAELMTSKLLRLSPEIHEALRLAAAFGAVCHEGLLQILDRGNVLPVRPRSTGGGGIVGLLNVAAAEGLVTYTDSAFRFSHDQIHSAAYLLTPETEREAFHLTIGRCLWKCSSQEELEAHLFVIVDQLRRGVGLIVEKDEKVNLAKLCLLAGQKASNIPAFSPAATYFIEGINLLSEGDWGNHHSLCLDLYNSCAEVEYVTADFKRMKDHLEQVLGHARTLKEKLRAYYCLVQSLGAQGNSNEAIDTSIVVLGQLGENFPSDPTEDDVKQEVTMTQKLLQKTCDDELLQLKTMNDPDKIEAMRFLNVMSLWVFLDKRYFFPLIVSRMVRLSLLHGVCRESAIGFANYGGLILCSKGEYRTGYRFGRLSASLLERFQAKEFHARVVGICNGFINNCVEPVQSCLPSHKLAIEMGLSTGDTEFAMANAQLYLGTALSTGQALGPLLEEMRTYSKQMVEYGHLKMSKLVTILQQVASYLQGLSEHPFEVVGDVPGQETLSNSSNEGRNKAHATMVFFYRMWLAYLFGRHKIAAEVAKMNLAAESVPRPRFILICNHFFYKGLNAIVMARITKDFKWVAVAKEAMKQMTAMAECTTWNCQHKLELMKAEYAFFEGEIGEASRLYDLAVDLATSHRFIHEQALALERAAIFYLENGHRVIASGYFMRAHQCYYKWGAYRKAEQLQAQFL